MSARRLLMQSKKSRRKRYAACDDVVEARGVEPLSENPLTRLSPGAAFAFTFPLAHTQRQVYAVSSFINPVCRKALAGSFPVSQRRLLKLREA